MSCNMNKPICHYNASGNLHCKNINKKNIEHFDVTSAKGDWIQMKYTESFVLTSYKIGGQKDFVLDSPIGNRPGQNRTPRDFVLLGSTNGTEWYLLDSQSNVVFTNTELIKTFTIQNPTLSLQFYRLVFTFHNSSVIPTIDFSRVLLYPTKNFDSITSNVPLHPLNSDGTPHPFMLNALKDDAASAAATPILTILSTLYKPDGNYDGTTTTPISPAPTSAPTTPAPTTPAPTTPGTTPGTTSAPKPPSEVTSDGPTLKEINKPNVSEEAKSSNEPNYTWLIIGGIVGTIVFIVLIYFLYKKFKIKNPPKTI